MYMYTPQSKNYSAQIISMMMHTHSLVQRKGNDENMKFINVKTHFKWRLRLTWLVFHFGFQVNLLLCMTAAVTRIILNLVWPVLNLKFVQ